MSRWRRYRRRHRRPHCPSPIVPGEPLRGVWMSPFHRDAWKTLWSITAPFFRSAQRWRATFAVGMLVALVLLVSYLNYQNSYVGRDVMAWLEERHAPEFATNAVKYVGLFAARTVSAGVLR